MNPFSSFSSKTSYKTFLAVQSVLTKVLVIAIWLTLTGCEPAEQHIRESPNTTITVTDYTGTPVVLEKAATRVIALAPHIVENIYSAGAGDLLVASVNYANFPAAATQLPVVGGYNQFNLEAIAALNPDLIIAWHSGTPQHFFDKIKQLGIPLYLDEPSTLEEIARSLRDIGKLTGHEVTAEQAAQRYLSRLQTLRAQQTHKAPITVFYQVWDDPLYTINGQQIISDVLALCGGVNIYADEKIKAPVISLESLVERDPHVIMTGSLDQRVDQALARWSTWETISAGKLDNLFVVNPDIVTRHTVRLLDGADSICTHLDTARQHVANQSTTFQQ